MKTGFVNGKLKDVRVLLVEDEFLIAEELADVLGDSGAKVLGPCSNLKQALNLANSLDMEVALLDVNLDGDHIYPVADVLAARAIPFVFMTGYSRDALPPEHRSRPVVRKPFQAAELLRVLDSLIAKKPH